MDLLHAFLSWQSSSNNLIDQIFDLVIDEFVL